MAQTLEQFAADCHDILKADPGPNGLEQVRGRLEKVLADKAFLSRYFTPENESDRNILYEDPDLGFCIIAHTYEGAKASQPHDHGDYWAIYGQAEGVTQMTEWRKIEPPSGDQPGKVEAVEVYDLKPGMARAYNVGQLHSPKRDHTTRLIRIEGRNLAAVKRDKYVAA